MNLSELKQKPIGELLEMTEALGLDNLARSRKNDIIFALLKKHAKGGEDIYGDGVLEILTAGLGLLRSPGASCLACACWGGARPRGGSSHRPCQPLL